MLERFNIADYIPAKGVEYPEGEFGRRLEENGSQGCDHGHGGVMFTLGPGVNGGKVYADWPGLAPEALDDPGDLAIITDFRDILAELVDKRLKNGNNLEGVFPGFTPDFLDIFQG